MAWQNTTKETLALWIDRAMQDPERTRIVEGKTVPAALVRLALCHISLGTEKEIDNVQVGTGWTDERIKGLAERFLGKADTDAEGKNGRQSYVLFAFYEGSNEPQASKPFQRNGHIVNSDGDHSSEPATPEGRLAQRMRHDEAYSQMLITANANVITQQSRLTEQIFSRLTEIMNQNIQMFDKMRDMMAQGALNEHEYRMKEATAERNNKLIESAVKLAPAMINRLTGQEIVPQSTADSALIEALAENLTTDDIQNLAPMLAKLPQAVVGLLMARLNEIEEQRQKKAQALKEALEANQGVFANGAAKHELES